MCFFLSCSPWHKPIPYFKVACNHFGFGFILKSKDQLSIFDNSDGSSSLASFALKFFKNGKKKVFFGVSTPFFSSKSDMMESFWLVFSAQYAFGKTWSHLICKIHAGLCNYLFSLLINYLSFVLYDFFTMEIYVHNFFFF